MTQVTNVSSVTPGSGVAGGSSTVASTNVAPSIAGIVVDSVTGQRIPGVTAQITAMPPAFQSIVSDRMTSYGTSWNTMTQRVDLTSTDVDGSFFFPNLPDGTYTVTFTTTTTVGLYGNTQSTFVVVYGSQLPISTIALPATGVKGLVQGSGSGGVVTPLAGARIQVTDSGEIASTYKDGSFYMPSVSVGSHSLTITNPTYNPTTITVVVALGVVTDAGIITISAAN